MPIFEMTDNEILPVTETTFNFAGLQERRDLQRLLRDHIEVIAPDTLLISEEFDEWEDAKRRIDLLAIDKNANLVAIELKRTEDGGYMELQCIRYASMVSTMTFDQAVSVFGRFLKRIGKESQDARETILEFLGWEESDDDLFAQDVRIILASAEFSKSPSGDFRPDCRVF
jgi:RecB family endonuclease NucS